MKFWLQRLVTLSALMASVAWAQTDYPNKALRMIVPFPPGGVTDIVARTVAVKLGSELGQQVVVDNRAGASGAIVQSWARVRPPMATP